MTDILIDTAAKITFVLVDTSGTEVTGLGTGFTLQVSKNGGAFAGSAGTKAEIGSGWYSYVFDVTETDTAGPLAVKITHASIAQQNLLYDVVGSSWSSVATYVSVADVKAYLGISGSGDDALLTSLVAKAEQFIETYTMRVFTVAADEARYLVPGVDSEGVDLYLPWDLCAITSVQVDADGASPVTLTANTDYITQPRHTTPYYLLRMMTNSAYSWSYASDPEKGVLITGRWGYSTTPPQDIIFCTMRLAAYYYRQKDASVFDTTALPDAGVIMIPQGVPKDVKMILDNYVRPRL